MTKYLVLLAELEMRTPWQLSATKNWANINFSFLKMAVQNQWLNSCQSFDSVTSCLLVYFLEEWIAILSLFLKIETNEFSRFQQF